MANFSALRLGLAVTLLAVCGSANAFRSVDFEGFTDPDYQDYQPKKVLLIVANGSNEMRDEIEERMTKELSKRGVTVVPSRKVFPPTRNWSAEDQAKILAKEEIDSSLIVTVGHSASSVIQYATQTHGSTNVNGTVNSNGTFNAHGTSRSTSQNMYTAKSKAEFSAVLMDAAANRAAWYADVSVKAGGTWFVSEKGDAKGLVGGVVKALDKDGHLPKK